MKVYFFGFIAFLFKIFVLVANNAQSSSKLNMGQLLCQQGSTARGVGFGQNISPESGIFRGVLLD